MGATVTALYGKKSYEGVIVSLGKPTDLLLELLFLSKAHINLDYPWTSLSYNYSFNKKIYIIFNKT